MEEPHRVGCPICSRVAKGHADDRSPVGLSGCLRDVDEAVKVGLGGKAVTLVGRHRQRGAEVLVEDDPKAINRGDVAVEVVVVAIREAQCVEDAELLAQLLIARLAPVETLRIPSVARRERSFIGLEDDDRLRLPGKQLGEQGLDPSVVYFSCST